MNTQSILSTFLAVAASMFFVNAANAARVDLDHSDQNAVFPDGNNYMKVVVREAGNGDIKFKVKPLKALTSVDGLANGGIESFAFNFGTSGAGIDNIKINGGKDWSASANQSLSSFGEFDVLLQGDKYKKNLKFKITGVDGDSVEDYLSELSRGGAKGNFLFGSGFATDVQLPLSGSVITDRAHFAGGTAAVPIPAAVWLLASGLSFLAFFGRRNAIARLRAQ